MGRARDGVLVLVALTAYAAVRGCGGGAGFLVPKTTSDTGLQLPAAALGRRDRLGLQPARVLREAPRPEAATAEGSTFCSTFTALCVVASVALAKGARRGDRVVRFSFPSMCHRPRQKVLRRLEAYGEIPAWSRRPLRTRRLVIPWRTRVTPRLSHYGRVQIERQRVRYHYNLKESQMQKYMRTAFKRGNDYPVDMFLAQLEQRLDNVLWRVGVVPTIPAARHFIREGHVQFQKPAYGPDKWVTSNIPSHPLRVGCKFRVSDKESSQSYGRRMQDEEGAVEVPSHLKWDRETMTGEVLDICDWQEFGLDVDYRHIIYAYSGPRGLRREHKRYHPGTNIEIKKLYNGGRIRPTPENLLNMGRRIGLNKRGRRLPPCLWGRKKPLNNPYEVSRKLKLHDW